MSEILSEEERSRLASLIAEVERSTAGEIVLVLARRSAAYGSFRLAWAALLALGASAVVHVCFPEMPGSFLLAMQGPLGLLFWWGLGWPGLLRRITPRREQQLAVSDRVKQLFLERGVTETRDRSGVLIFLSELEHRVEILGDRGIHEHLGAEAWQKMVGDLVGAIGGGNAAQGLSAIIERIGRELAAKFPPRPDDTNELPDEVALDRRYG